MTDPRSANGNRNEPLEKGGVRLKKTLRSSPLENAYSHPLLGVLGAFSPVK